MGEGDHPPCTKERSDEGRVGIPPSAAKGRDPCEREGQSPLAVISSLLYFDRLLFALTHVCQLFSAILTALPPLRCALTHVCQLFLAILTALPPLRCALPYVCQHLIFAYVQKFPENCGL